jgi:hypothetical protein
MKGQVSAGWLNALIILATLILFVSFVGSVVGGIIVGKNVVDWNTSDCVYDAATQHYYDSNDMSCQP